MPRFLAVLTCSALIFASCGGDPGPDPAEDPKASVVSAFERLGESGVTLTIRLESTVEDLVASSAAEGGDPLSEEDAQKFLDSSVRITGNGESDPDKQEAEISVNVAGIENAVELKFAGDVLYVRAAVRDLADEFGLDQSELDQAKEQTPPGFEFVGPAIEGEWLSIAGFEQLAQQFGGQPSEEQEEDAQKFAEELARILENNSEVEHQGSDAVGDRMTISVGARDAYAEFTEALGSLGTLATGQLAQLPPASEVPDRDIRIDVWVADGAVKQVLFDIMQFRDWEGADIPEDVETFGILVQLETFDGAIEVPDDANAVDIEKLMQGFFGMGGSSVESSTPTDITEEGTELPDDFCEQLAEAPPEVQEQFSAECPELAN